MKKVNSYIEDNIDHFYKYDYNKSQEKNFINKAQLHNKLLEGMEKIVLNKMRKKEFNHKSELRNFVDKPMKYSRDYVDELIEKHIKYLNSNY